MKRMTEEYSLEQRSEEGDVDSRIRAQLEIDGGVNVSLPFN